MSFTGSLTARRFALASLLTVLSTVATLGLAQSASAESHCVGSHPACVGPSYSATQAGLQSALNAANNNSTYPGADTVYIEAGTITLTSTVQLGTASGPLSVIGEGIGATILEAGANNIQGVQLSNPMQYNVSMSDLTSRSIGFGSGSALSGTNVAYSDVSVEVVATSGGVRGFFVNGTSTISNSSIKLTGGSAYGIYTDDTITVSDSLFESTDGLSFAINSSGNGDTRTVERTTFRNVRRAVSMDSGSLNVSDSFVLLGTSSGSVGFFAENSNDCDTCVIDLVADNVTVVGTGANAVGISTGATGSDGIGEVGTAVITNSLVHVTGSGSTALRCSQSGDSTSASMNTSFVAANVAKIVRTGTCAGADSSQLDTTSNAPTFNFPEIGDYRPTAASPVVEAGDPTAVVDPGDTDVDGDDRLFDGDGTGGDRIDIGAYEFQPAQAPSKAQLTATPDPANVNQTINFSALAKEPDAGAVTYAWNFGDSTNGVGPNPTHAYTGPGDYTVTVVATDNEGQQSTTVDEVHVTSDPPTAPTVESDVSTAYRGEDITFTASGSTDLNGDDIHYEWEFTGGGIASSAEGAGVVRQATNMVTGAGPTLYTAQVRAVDEFGEESAPVSVDVTIFNRMPTITSIPKSSSTAYRGDVITFQMDADDAIAENDTIVGSWDFGDGQPATAFDNDFEVFRSYSTVGVKTVSLTVRDSYHLQAGPGEVEDTDTTTVEILNRDPVVGAIEHSGSLLVSDQQTFSISATESEGDAVSYRWDFGDGTSTAASPQSTASKTFATPGTYTVTATVLDDQGAAVAVQRSITIAGRKAVITLGKPNKSFWARSKGFTLGGRAPYAYIPVTTTEPVTVRITLQRIKGGFSKGARCVTRKVSRKRCDLKLAGSQSIDLLDSSSKLMFGAKWRRKTLPPGRYRVTLTPLDGGQAKSVNIRIVKKKK